MDGFIAITAKRARRNEKSVTARIKTLCYLDNVIAQTEAEAAGADEAIMLNNQDAIACGGRSNLFAVIDGALRRRRSRMVRCPASPAAPSGACNAADISVVEGAVARLELLGGERDVLHQFAGGDHAHSPGRRRRVAVGPITKRLARPMRT